MRQAILAALTLTGSIFLVGGALAQSFDGADVEGFIAVMEGAEDIGERYKDKPESKALQSQMDVDVTDFGALLDEDGDFRVFRLSAEAMSRSPDAAPVKDYRKLVTANGFADLGTFGATADAIMMAWMATRLSGEDLGGMDAMGDIPPEMMAMMPPEVRAQMAGVMKLGRALERVPAEDIDALRPYQARLDAAFE